MFEAKMSSTPNYNNYYHLFEAKISSIPKYDNYHLDVWS